MQTDPNVEIMTRLFNQYTNGSNAQVQDDRRAFFAALDRISSRLAELERLRAEAEDECARLGFVIARLRTIEDVARECRWLMLARPGDFPQATIDRLRTALEGGEA